jgi:hypothetical protein
MALPSEALHCNDINDLPQGLGKLGCIEAEEVSGTSPKLSGLQRLDSAAATAVYNAINRVHTPEQLDEIAKMMWGNHVEGAISEDDVTFLSGCIDRRRPTSRRTGSGHAAQLSRLNGRLQSRFKSRQRKRCPTVKRQETADVCSADRARSPTV